VTDFLAKKPTLDANWRAVVLFGRNVAYYKFALAAALRCGPAGRPHAFPGSRCTLRAAVHVLFHLCWLPEKTAALVAPPKFREETSKKAVHRSASAGRRMTFAVAARKWFFAATHKKPGSIEVL
jgi:hypothetical protein